MKKAIFPGTFEIFHEGHVHILKKALKLFDYIYVVVAINPEKESSNIEQRYENVKKRIDELKIDNVSVIKWAFNVVEIAKIKQVCFIIRGVRNEKDFLYEKMLLDEYKKEWDEIESVYFISNKELSNISSRNLIKQNK